MAGLDWHFEHLDTRAIIDRLLEGGADVNVPCKHGQTALSIAIRRGKTETANKLKAYGAKDRSTDAARDPTPR